MDPLSAVSLASAIVQFVDFASRIVSGALEIRKSATGATRDNVTVEDATTKLRSLNHKLARGCQGQAAAGPQSPLEQLTQQCLALSGKLLMKMNTLKAAKGSSTFTTFRKALKAMWAKDEIDAMKVRLNEIRDLQMLAILVNIRYVEDCLYTDACSTGTEASSLLNASILSPTH